MSISYAQYLKARYGNTMAHYVNSAKNAMLHIRADEKLNAWKAEIGASNYKRAFTTDRHDIAHEFETPDGYKLIFKIEADYDSVREDDINAQGYSVKLHKRYKPDFAEFGQFTRHSGKGIEAFISVGDRDTCYAAFDIPESYMRQFYDNKNYSKHDAYINMVASTRLAIEQDIKNAFKTEYYCISIVIEKDGEELETCGIGSVDEDYAVSGNAFLDYSYPDAMEFIAKDREARATDYAAIVTASRPDMYEAAAMA